MSDERVERRMAAVTRLSGVQLPDPFEYRVARFFASSPPQVSETFAAPGEALDKVRDLRDANPDQVWALIITQNSVPPV